MFIAPVEALHVGNRVVGTEAGQRVDVAVGVVACKIAMVEPKDAFGMERCKQTRFDLCLLERLVAMRGEQTLARGKDSSLAVALYAAAFEHEVEVILVLTLQNALLRHPSADLVVKVGRELLAPTVEAEIEQMQPVRGKQGDEAVVAGPRVVGGSFAERNTL